MQEEILKWLVSQAPVVVVMGIVIWALFKKLEKSEEEVKELNQYIREKTLEMLITLKDTVVVLDKLSAAHHDVKEEVSNLRIQIMSKIEQSEKINDIRYAKDK